MVVLASLLVSLFPKLAAVIITMYLNTLLSAGKDIKVFLIQQAFSWEK